MKNQKYEWLLVAISVVVVLAILGYGAAKAVRYHQEAHGDLAKQEAAMREIVEQYQAHGEVRSVPPCVYSWKLTKNSQGMPRLFICTANGAYYAYPNQEFTADNISWDPGYGED